MIPKVKNYKSQTVVIGWSSDKLAAPKGPTRGQVFVERPCHENHHPLLRRLRLRAASPPCEGTTARACRRRRRADPLERRRVRDFGRWRAEVLQGGARPISERRRDRRAGKRVTAKAD